MSDKKEHLHDVTGMLSMMERSSRFISLSGLSGIFAGIFALCGAYIAYTELDFYNSVEVYPNRIPTQFEYIDISVAFVMIAAVVLFSSLTVGMFFTLRNSSLKIWDTTSNHLLINLLIPLVAGGLFCFILLYHGLIGLVAPSTLLFYGLSLINASKYTFSDVRYLGLCEIVLGLAASLYINYGLLFWAIGFGLLHIINGTIMHFKYKR